MGDVGDDFRALNDYRKQQKRLHGVDCPGCPVIQPKRIPTRLMPGQKCRVCGYRDPRKDARND